MMCKILLLLVLLLYLKWILMLIFFPFQAICGQLMRRNWSLKKIAVFCAPYLAWEWLLRWGWQRYMLYQVSTLPSCHLRKFIYKALGASVGPKVVFHFRTEIRYPHCLTVGRGTIIGDNALLDARRGLTLGNHVNISSNVSIYTEQHDHRDPDFRCTNPETKAVSVGDRVWLGSNVVVLPGVTIGEGAVCCAGCVVTKDVPPYAIVAGIPARQVAERPKNLRYEFDGKTYRLY